MAKTDFISALIGLSVALALLFWIIPVYIPQTYTGSYGLYAQSLPRFLAFLLLFLSALLLLFAVRGMRRTGDNGPPIRGARLVQHTFLSAAVLIATAALMAEFGFLAGGTAVVLVFMLLMGERRPVPLLTVAIASPLVIWALIWQLLGYRLP